jgi:hypothetical protein
VATHLHANEASQWVRFVAGQRAGDGLLQHISAFFSGRCGFPLGFDWVRLGSFRFCAILLERAAQV